MIYSHANVQGQRSVGSEDRVETNGRTDGSDCIISRVNAVGNYGFSVIFSVHMNVTTVSVETVSLTF